MSEFREREKNLSPCRSFLKSTRNLTISRRSCAGTAENVQKSVQNCCFVHYYLLVTLSGLVKVFKMSSLWSPF